MRKSKDFEYQYLKLIIFLFALLASYFALNLQSKIIPDEVHHFYVSKLYANTWGIPENSQDTYQYSYLNHKPFLYYWINGRALNILHVLSPMPTERTELITLRLISVAFSIGTLIFTYKLSQELISSAGGRLLAVFLLSNTLMFIFLSGGVNYDNLVNLTSTISLYFFVKSIKGENFVNNSIFTFSFLAFGLLVKRTLIPLALPIGIIWIIYCIKFLKQGKIRIHRTKFIFIQIFFLVILIFGNAAIYGVNIIKYQKIMPACDQILTVEQCEQNAVYARNQNILTNTSSIDRLIESSFNHQDPIEYFLKYWSFSMVDRIYGIMGHKHYFHSLINTFVIGLILWTTFWIFRSWTKKDHLQTALIIIAVFYTLTLLWTNYSFELATDFMHVAIQGRYIFPVLPAIYVLMANYIIKIRPILLKRITIFAFVIIFFLAGSYTLLWNYDYFSSWFI